MAGKNHLGFTTLVSGFRRPASSRKSRRNSLPMRFGGGLPRLRLEENPRRLYVKSLAISADLWSCGYTGNTAPYDLWSMCIFKPKCIHAVIRLGGHFSGSSTSIIEGPHPATANQWATSAKLQEHGWQLIRGVRNLQLIIQLDHLSTVELGANLEDHWRMPDVGHIGGPSKDSGPEILRTIFLGFPRWFAGIPSAL